MYRIKNMTFSPLRIIIDGSDVRLFPREYTILPKITQDLLNLEKQKLIKIRETK